MWVTHLKSKGATEAELVDLASLMKHSRRVQEAWYDLTLKSYQAKRACQAISQQFKVSMSTKPRARAPR
jgi:hypothetical protein